MSIASILILCFMTSKETSRTTVFILIEERALIEARGHFIEEIAIM